MGRLVNIRISLGKQEWTSVSHLSIAQSADRHSRIDLRVQAPAERPDLLQQITGDWLGRTLNIAIEARDKRSGSNRFRGVVTETGVARGYAGELDCLITAYSPGLLLDGAPRCRSFSEKTLEEIVQAVVKPYTGVAWQVQIQHNPMIPYAVQYRETDWQFLARLADTYGEWLYDDGEVLHFGRNPENPALDIRFGHDLEWFSSTAAARPTGFSRQSYDYLAHTMREIDSTGMETRVNGAAVYDLARKQSDELYPAAAMPTDRPAPSETALKQFVRTEKNSRNGSLLQLHGSGDHPGLETGQKFQLQSAAPDGKPVDHGFWIVTHIAHQVQATGEYTNSIQAQAAFALQAPPNPFVLQPKAGAQAAVVVENNDPDQLGRVRIRFKWQEETREMSPWIRCNRQHAGKDRGFYFVPETGDEILAGFENEGNPDCPYVQDALYHGDNRPKQWADSDNNYKAIRTRGTNEVIFCDAKNREWLHLHNIREGMAPPVVENTLKLSLEGEGALTARNEKRMGGSKQALFAPFLGGDPGGLPVRNEITLDLSGQGKITIRNERGGGVRNEICLSLDGNGKITIETPKGDVEIKAANIRLEAKDDLELKAKRIRMQSENDTKIAAGSELVENAPVIRLN